MTNEEYVPELMFGHTMAQRLGYALIGRFALVNFQIFVSWKRGPACWIKIAPTVMYLLCLLNYILFPLASGYWFYIRADAMQHSIYGIYLWCVGIIWLIQMTFYLRIIKPYIYFNAMAYIASRKQAMDAKNGGVNISGSSSDELNGTVDFPHNNSNPEGSSSTKEEGYQMNYSADQGTFGGPSPDDLANKRQSFNDEPPSPPESANKNNDSSFIDQNENGKQYTELPRAFGDGEIRIGEFLNLNEDIYSLGFASLVRNELVDEILLKEDAGRPKQAYLPIKTPRGGFTTP